MCVASQQCDLHQLWKRNLVRLWYIRRGQHLFSLRQWQLEQLFAFVQFQSQLPRLHAVLLWLCFKLRFLQYLHKCRLLLVQFKWRDLYLFKFGCLCERV